MALPQSKPATLAATAAALLAAAAAAAAAPGTTPFVCDGSSSEPYRATKEYQGCYLDPGVNILREAKLSTIAMTPQYCANWCGGQGFAYGGVNFGTQCFCGGSPDFSRATKTDDSRCSTKCATEPSSACGATYVMSLYKVTNPQGEAGDGTNSTPNPPACQTNPLCSHPVCDTSKSIAERVASLVGSFTEEEKILNLIDASAGAERLGLPSHEWWNEATHGVGSAPGVVFPKPPRDFNHATSFPSPILTAASFDGPLMRAIGDVVGIEGRAFGNNGFSGFNFWAPNMNPFREPRWGRGQETPGEDVLLVKTYTQNYVSGMQGDDPEDKLIIANCKHYAAYDLETGRHANNYNPTQQDLADYYLSAFKTCVRDAHVGSIMCSYNSVGGIPTCSSPYLLQEVLRDHWNFTAAYDFVVSDCGAVTDIVQYHNFTDTEQGAAAVALNAGTDLECGNSYLKLNESLADGETTVARMDEALTRLYTALFSVGYFDGGKHHTLGWANVSTEHATELAYRAAVEGMTLLRNDGLLPLRRAEYKSVAVVGPYANATTEMQGDYSGKAPFLRSPLSAFQAQAGWAVHYAKGTPISAQNTTGFAEALEAAQKADLVVYCGGIDNSLENETNDRKSIAWPANQLELIAELAKLAKPLVVAQFGGGQVDGTPLVENENVNALLWAGYPSQDGGTALLDLLVGEQAFAGRLPITQYPAQYAEDVSMFDINLRPNGSFPGRTYMWYTGEPVFPFGHGLSYTTFDFGWKTTLEEEYDIGSLVKAAQANANTNGSAVVNDATPFATVAVDVENVGDHKSDYVGLLFLSSRNAGPEPRPNKVLASFARAHGIDAGCRAELPLALTLGSLARADEKGDLTIFPGDYKLALDNDESLTFEFRLTGEATVIETLPVPKDNYEFSVPVHIQPPSTERMGPD